MSRKRFLLFSVLVIGGIGIVLMTLPFVLSLNPSAKADAALFTIDTSKIDNGTYKIVHHPLRPHWQKNLTWSVMLIKKEDGSSTAWLIPTKGNMVMMPDLHWWRPMFECADFGPTVKNGKIEENSPIKCHDQNVPEWWRDKWQWDINGKNYSKQIDDMETAVGVVEGGFYVVGKN